jgi:hypothetical protein
VKGCKHHSGALGEYQKDKMQSEANKMVRVLVGKPLKFTVRITLPDREVVEFQSNSRPEIKWQSDARGLWLYSGGGYGCSGEIMAWPDGSMILVEENPQ